jgi:antitoxin component YwqK of YwqJK toxin-antitoxin module
MEGVARNGVRCGEWTIWREDGSLESRGRYRDSFQDGEWVVYAADGVTEEKRYLYERSVRTKVLPAAAPRRN